MKQIKVSDSVHDTLARIKQRDEHTSFDSAIRSLLTHHQPDMPFTVPDAESLSAEQAEEILSVWGNQSVDYDSNRGTATVTTPPMTSEQIAVVTLNAALSRKPVGAYAYCAAASGAYMIDPRLDDPAVDAQKYIEHIETLKQIVNIS